MKTFADGNRRVVKGTNKFDIELYSQVMAFSLLVNVPSAKSKIDWYKAQVPNMVRLLEHYGTGDGHSIIRYIILVYDKKSPFRVSAPILKNRKNTVAKIVDLKGKLVDACIDLSERLIASAVVDYLRYQDDTTWRLILQCQEVFDSNEQEIFMQLSADTSDKDRLAAAKVKSALIQEQEKLQETLNSLYTKFTGNDPNAEIAVKRVSFRPETVATMLDEEE